MIDGWSAVARLVRLNLVPRSMFRPFFVVMTMAPFEAREPYSAAAFGPLSTVSEATSSMFRSAMALP